MPYPSSFEGWERYSVISQKLQTQTHKCITLHLYSASSVLLPWYKYGLWSRTDSQQEMEKTPQPSWYPKWNRVHSSTHSALMENTTEPFLIFVKPSYKYETFLSPKITKVFATLLGTSYINPLSLVWPHYTSKVRLPTYSSTAMESKTTH